MQREMHGCAQSADTERLGDILYSQINCSEAVHGDLAMNLSSPIRFTTILEFVIGMGQSVW